jgi:hypothetical protein
MPTGSSILHVVVGARGAWVVAEADPQALTPPEPPYPEATSAIRAATRELAARDGGGELLVHDCYYRVHARHCGPPLDAPR